MKTIVTENVYQENPCRPVSSVAASVCILLREHPLGSAGQVLARVTLADVNCTVQQVYVKDFMTAIICNKRIVLCCFKLLV